MTWVMYVFLVLSRCFVCLWLSSFVLNQTQLFIVVSDWEPYLGSHIPWVIRGSLSMC